MSGDVAEWDQEAATPAPAPAAPRTRRLPPQPGTESAANTAPDTGARAVPQLFLVRLMSFCARSCDSRTRAVSARRVPCGGRRTGGAIRRRSADSMPLWRAWEALRLEGTFGMSMWWRDHADHHMRMLMSPEGPFAAARDQNGEGDPLPYTAPPAGMLIDVRTLPS